jgi:BolA protein
MSQSSPIKDRILRKLSEKFTPQELEVIDESDRHKGHAGHDGAGESHFMVLIVSSSFDGKGRVERHRMVYETLDLEIRERVHALSIKAFSPSERPV